MLFRSKVLYFSNTSNGILVVTDLNERLKANDRIVGAYSNASFIVSSVDNSPVKTVAIIVTPDPPSANGNGAFGFDELIIEYPDTLT